MIFIESPTVEQIKEFFKANPRNQKTFRYFKKRNFDVIKNHKKTILIFENELYLAYGHLDFESNKTWLGIMVCDKCVGKGIGTKLMKKLLEGVTEEIFLSVDKNNNSAINLYKKNNFILTEEYENYFIMKKNKL
jgi:hypothetical protein